MLWDIVSGSFELKGFASKYLNSIPDVRAVPLSLRRGVECRLQHGRKVWIVMACADIPFAVQLSFPCIGFCSHLCCVELAIVVLEVR